MAVRGRGRRDSGARVPGCHLVRRRLDSETAPRSGARVGGPLDRVYGTPTRRALYRRGRAPTGEAKARGNDALRRIPCAAPALVCGPDAARNSWRDLRVEEGFRALRSHQQAALTV